MSASPSPPQVRSWLLLAQQPPAQPPYFRVKVWRRLQAIGAVAVKASVYALPQTDAALEDFQWLLKEVIAAGGEAMIFEAQMVDGLNDDDLITLFNTARGADYAELSREAEALAADVRTPVQASADREGEWRAQLKRLGKRFHQIAAIDFFGAPGRDAIRALLAGVEANLNPPPADRFPAVTPTDDYHGRIWVTRTGVHVDRIASAWLIRRFVDPQAVFKFVSAKGYRPAPGELRFDMFEAEFSHEGDRCSFETLLVRRGIADPGLQAIAEIIHDLDIKDDKFGRPETAGIGRMLEAIAAAHPTDEARIARGSAMLDDLYALFGAV